MKLAVIEKSGLLHTFVANYDAFFDLTRMAKSRCDILQPYQEMILLEPRVPDRSIHNFRASKSGDRRIICSSGTLNDAF